MPALPTPPQTFDLTLEEFCTRLSSQDRRPEMISGFHSDEVRNGRVKDSQQAFADRYAAFAVRPA